MRVDAHDARITHLLHFDHSRGAVNPHAEAGFRILANLHTGRVWITAHILSFSHDTFSH